MPETMDEEDDDFYDPADSVPAGQGVNNIHNATPGPVQDSNDMEEDEEVEVEDDDVRS